MEYALIAVLLLAGVAIVMRPLLSADAAAPDPTTTAAGEDGLDDRALAAEVGRYRASLRAGTVCPRCKEANPAGSRYCADCGRLLESVSKNVGAAATPLAASDDAPSDRDPANAGAGSRA